MVQPIENDRVFAYIQQRKPFVSKGPTRLIGRWNEDDKSMYGVFYGVFIVLLHEPCAGRWYYTRSEPEVDAMADNGILLWKRAANELSANNVSWGTMHSIWRFGLADTMARRLR